MTAEHKNNMSTKTKINKVSESVYAAKELGNIVLLLFYYHYHVLLKNAFVVYLNSCIRLNVFDNNKDNFDNNKDKML